MAMFLVCIVSGFLAVIWVVAYVSYEIGVDDGRNESIVPREDYVIDS